MAMLLLFLPLAYEVWIETHARIIHKHMAIYFTDVHFRDLAGENISDCSFEAWAQRAAAPSRNKWEKASRRAGTLNRADRRRAVEQSVRANRHAASSLTPRTVPPTREAFCMKRPRFNESSAKREMPVNAYASLPSAGLHRDARANPRYQIYEWSRIENYPVSLGSRLRGAP